MEVKTNGGEDEWRKGDNRTECKKAMTWERYKYYKKEKEKTYK